MTHDPDKLRIFEVLARQHESMLMAYILGIVSDRKLAEDIAQQALIIAFRKISALREPDRFAAWLRAIARREALSAMRSNKNEVPMEPAILDEFERAFALMEQDRCDTWEERFRVVEECYAELPADLREVCRHHYFQDRKAREIAVDLEIALATVLKRLERARLAIRRCVEGRLKQSYG